MAKLHGILGLLAILACAYLFSKHRSAIQKRVLIWGITLQFAFAFLVLKTRFGELFYGVSLFVNAMLNYTTAGSTFVFGDQLGARTQQFGVIFAFQVLPIVIFICSFFAILYYLRRHAVVCEGHGGGDAAIHGNQRCGIYLCSGEHRHGSDRGSCHHPSVPRNVDGIRAVHDHDERYGTCIGGCDGGLCCDCRRLDHTPSNRRDHDRACHHHAREALRPRDRRAADCWNRQGGSGTPGVNLVDAAARGAGDGLHLALNIAGMLIAFLALIAMVNGGFGWVHAHIGWFPASLQQVLAILFAPIAWLLGVEWKDCAAVGNLLGTRMVLNEFVAFVDLGKVKDALDPRSFVIATFALCGFANLSSIAIQIGGIGGLAPSRKSDLAKLGFKAMIVGTLANFMSACIAGILL